MRETTLITGASGGLGKEFAVLFAEDGCDLVLISRKREQLEGLKEELERKYPITVTVLAKDLSHPQSPQEIMQYLQKTGTIVTTLVNNAGFGVYGPFSQGDFTKEQDMMQVNMMALTTLTKLLLPSMISAQHGRILNVASIAAFQGGPLMAVYYATKAYILSFSQALSNELQGTGISVTCLCPGPTLTGFAAEAHMEASRLFRNHTMDAKSVALAGYRGCMKGKPLIIPGWKNKVLAFTTRLLPRRLCTSIARKAQEQY